MELLSHPALDGLKVMIVFSKMDRKTSRQVNELKSLMRLEEVMEKSNHDISDISFNIEKQENLTTIFEWIMQFKIDVVETPKFDFPLA